MKESIIVDLSNRQCAVCGRSVGLQLHHVLHGPNRRLADKYGLTVWLCSDCHGKLHGSPDPQWRDVDRELMADAQRAFENIYGHESWMDLFGKDYIAQWESQE